MPGFLLHVGATVQCFHLAPASITPSQARVMVSGQPVALASNVIVVTGCLFQVPTPAGPKPQPCVKVQWTMVSSRVLVMGEPPLLQPSPGSGPGICQSVEQIPQGVPTVAAMQARVVAL